MLGVAAEVVVVVRLVKELVHAVRFLFCGKNGNLVIIVILFDFC